MAAESREIFAPGGRMGGEIASRCHWRIESGSAGLKTSHSGSKSDVFPPWPAPAVKYALGTRADSRIGTFVA